MTTRNGQTLPLLIFCLSIWVVTPAAQAVGRPPRDGGVFWSAAFTKGRDFDEKSGAWADGATRISAEGFLHLFANNTRDSEVSVATEAGWDLQHEREQMHVLVSLRLGQKNTARSIRVCLVSNAKKMCWLLPLAKFTAGHFTVVPVSLSEAPLGKDVGFDWGAVDKITLGAGEPFSGEVDLHIERISLAKIPPKGRRLIVGKRDSSDPAGAIYFSSIQAAVDASAPRDVIVVKPGIYHETVVLRKDYGMQDSRLMIMAAKNGAVILEGRAGVDSQNNFTGLQQGFNWTPLQKDSDIRANHIEIAGFIVRDFVGNGLGDRDCGKITIRNCLIHSNGTAGIAMNFPSPDTRLRIVGNIVLLNGWGEAWAGGIHINNKDVRLNSITRDADGNSLPNDEDPGHEIAGNVSFLNLDESQYNSDGNGIMLDHAGGSEASITGNIVFFNAGAGIRNLNGRALISNNVIVKNGWDNRGSPSAGSGELPSTNEQVGLLLRHHSSVYRGTLQEFLDFNHAEFIKSRLEKNIIWTASQFNLDGVYNGTGDEQKRQRSLSQFAIEMGVWNLFRGDLPAPETTPPTGHTQRQKINGHKLSAGKNYVTDDFYVSSKNNPENRVAMPQTRQRDLCEFFAPDEHPFTKLPPPHYEPAAIRHLFGRTLRNERGEVEPLSEQTQSYGMVWNTKVKKNLSSKRDRVAVPGQRPPLGLEDIDFSIRQGAFQDLAALCPKIPLDPDYAAVFLQYLNSEFPTSQTLKKLPFDWAAAPLKAP